MDDAEPRGFQPLYGIDGHGTGPQCSHSHDFCFFCAFDECPEAANKNSSADLYGSLKDVVRSMAASNRELPVIVNMVHNHYEEHVRDFVEYEHPQTRAVISKPVWTRQSIRRHLLFSTEFKELFNVVIQQMYHSMIALQNQNMCDAATGEVDGDRAKQFHDTMKSYVQFMRYYDERRLKPG